MDGLDKLFGEISSQGQEAQTETQPTELNGEQHSSSETSETTQAPLDSTSQGQETSQSQETEANAQEEGGASNEVDELEEWDSSESKNETSETISEDWKELSKALDIPFERKEHVIAEIQKMKEDRISMEKELELLKKSDPFVSDDFKKANEIAKLGGDWREYLEISSTDYDNFDDETLVVADISRYFPDNEQGREEMEAYVSNLSDFDKRIQASKIRESLKVNQHQLKLQKEHEAIEKKRAADDNLRKVLDKTEQIAGLKLKPTHRKDIYEKLSSGKIVNDLFYNENGQLDFDKMVKSAFVLQNFDKIIGYYQNRSKNEGKKEVINNINNLDLSSTSKMPSPKPQSNSPLDSWMNNLSQNG